MRFQVRDSLVIGALAACAIGTSLLCGQEADLGRSQDAVILLQKYLRVDTTNPPGNESCAVAFFAEILKAEGISFETAEKCRDEAIYGRV